MPKDKITVVVLGSSISTGWGASQISKSWVGLLKKETKDSIINLSVPGYSTYSVLPYNLPNYRNIVPDKLKNIDAAINTSPDLIVFSLTTNDIGLGYSISEYLNNMKVLTDLCISNKIEYLITSTTPRTTYTPEQRKALYELKGQLEKIYNNRFVEIYNSIADLKTFKFKPNFSTNDSIHPNDFGHLFIFNNFLPRYLETKKRILRQ